ncbi:carbon-nitrogen hydrolase family protein [Parvibaculum sp.]|uniref:carbon-nitrogen hydrolase family protein n=1 Tax=Parvibaculum sp. TaxID=2024848 RepID=UPI001E10BE17|nr:carbon-nitrogen hydrolase family protein [Parvibaculum sp.]MBX3489298.1 carbon-nitrogen hydrolase family protein [Parvibaculum sp.]MCW5726746.1 carbon-nitrogen hydrolase family protein [Parvibaculum sp.]
MDTARTFTAALVQMRAGRDVAVNIADVSGLVSEAAAQGADFVMTPEMTSLLETKSERLFANTFEEKDDPALAALRALAAAKKIWLLIGSLPVKISPQKLANRSFLIAPDGGVAARYDKIHMFDVDLEGGESYRESKNFEPGRAAVIADLPWGRLGMTVCYDLRFPQLYRALAQAGAGFLTVPAAFTRQTGEAHWHTLLKARAIETGCYVFAPAQGGKHECGRETFGHSLVIAPWGEIVAEAAHDAPCVVLAEIDTARIAEARGRVPSLGHDRDFALPVVKAERRAS